MHLQIYKYISTPPKNNDIFYATDYSSSSSESPVTKFMPN